MKPANFQARKLTRQVNALARFKPVPDHAQKAIEFAVLTEVVSAGHAARDIRTKKHRGPRTAF